MGPETCALADSGFGYSYMKQASMPPRIVQGSEERMLLIWTSLYHLHQSEQSVTDSHETFDLRPRISSRLWSYSANLFALV